MTGKLILLRHGESGWNAKNLFTGWVDVSINEKGEAKARRVVKLPTLGGSLPTVLYTLLLCRTIHTAYLALDGRDRHWIPIRHSWRLDERRYGMLRGLDRTATRNEHGDEQFMLWRYDSDILPPVQGIDVEYSQFSDPRYADTPADGCPRTECFKDVVARMLLHWEESIIPDLDAGHTTPVTAHGSSLCTLVKHLDSISGEDIAGLNIPAGIPLFYELDGNHGSLVKGGRYLDPEAAAVSIEAVRSQDKK